MKFTILIVPPIFLLLSHCSSSIPPEFGMVDWSLSNGTGNSMTISVYDKICQRTYYRVRLSRSGQAEMSTCANSDGRAEIRYRRAGYDTGDYPWTDARIDRNQSFILRF